MLWTEDCCLWTIYHLFFLMHYEIKIINWVKTVFAELPDANSTTLEVLVKAGSFYETQATNGLSHFLEHMFFKWWKNYTTPKDVAEALDSFWARYNAFTSEEYAGYYITSAPAYTFRALDILADMLVGSQFPKEEMEREKGVIIQEVMMYEDNPQQQVIEKRRDWYYGNSSYGRSILGPVENIQNFTQDDLFAHKEGLYTKDNLILIVAGNMEHRKELETQIGDLFGPLGEKKSTPTPDFAPVKPTVHEANYVKETQQNHVIIWADGWTIYDEERFAARMLWTILGGMMSSRLFQHIREQRGLCYYIGAAHYPGDVTGAFWIYAGMEKARRSEWFAAIYDEIAAIATNDVTEEEFEKALGNISGNTQMGIETSNQLASFIGNQLLYKDEIMTLEDILGKYQSLTPGDLSEVAKALTKEKLWAYWIE